MNLLQRAKLAARVLVRGPVLTSTNPRTPAPAIQLQNTESSEANVPRPIAWAIVSTDHGLLIVNRNDRNTKEGYGAYGVGHQLLEHSQFDLAEIQFALNMLRFQREVRGDGVVALDCGANIGVHTVEWAKMLTGWGEVIAVEAQERVFYALCGNLTINNAFNARAIWAAVGEKEGTIQVPAIDYSLPASFGSLEIGEKRSDEDIGQPTLYSSTHSYAVPLFPLDQIATQRVDFIKLDVEGMELEVLRGARQTILREHPLMIIEALKTDKESLKAALTELGYIVYALSQNFIAIPSSVRASFEARFIGALSSRGVNAVD